MFVYLFIFVVAARNRFGGKATPAFVNEKAKRALQNMSDEKARVRGKARGPAASVRSVIDSDSPSQSYAGSE